MINVSTRIFLRVEFFHFSTKHSGRNIKIYDGGSYNILGHSKFERESLDHLTNTDIDIVMFIE